MRDQLERTRVEPGRRGRWLYGEHPLRSRLGRRFPWARAVYRDLVFVPQLVRERYWRMRHGRGLHGGGTFDREAQAVMTWDLDLPDVASPADLVDQLVARGLDVSEGKHSIYLPAQPGLAAVVPELARFYPPASGLKILKDLAPPDEARYLTGDSGTRVRQEVVGSLPAMLVAGNYLHQLGLGPAMWDLVHLRSRNLDLTAFVVEHIGGGAPTPEECARFMDELAGATQHSQLRVAVPGWQNHPDFACPECNGNLVMDDQSARPRYVDFQSFRVTGPAWTSEVAQASVDAVSFGWGRALRGNSYLYQQVPGVKQGSKRNTQRRWELLTTELRAAGIELDRRLVLDIGCNTGMMLYLALASGAGWALGWDRASVVPRSAELLHSLGATRFSLAGADLHPNYDVVADVPAHLVPFLSDSIVFYLAIREHIGVLECLESMRWHAMVYEGHQGERVEDLDADLRPLLKAGARIVRRTRVADGDSTPRPFAVLLRD